MKKKSTLILLVMLLVLAFAMPVSAASFTDVKDSDWFAPFVYDLSDQNILSGYPDGTFRPQNTVTRGEFVKILAFASKDDLSDYGKNLPFADSKNHWSKANIDWAYQNGIVKGKSATSFDPDGKITRQEMAVMIYRYAGYKKIEFPKIAEPIAFNDGSNIASWAKDAVLAMQQAQIINGYDDKTFRPLKNATRAESSKMISSYLDNERKAENLIGYGQCGENVYWKLDNNGTLTIFGSGGFTGFDCPWLRHDLVETVVIGKNVVVNSSDFYYFPELNNFIVEPGNLSCCTIDGVLFSYDKSDLICYPAGKKSESYVIPNFVTEISWSAFEGCDSLTNIIIPNSVKDIGGFAFSGCSKLESINIPEGVQEIEYLLFEGCVSLRNITIPKSVTEIGVSAFGGCSELTNIVIPDGVTDICGGAFYGCTGLENIIIPSSVDNIGGNAFANCSNLKKIEIPKGIVKIEDDVFNGCSNLTNVVIPNSVTHIGSNSFSGCVELEQIKIPNSVKKIDYRAFDGCISLKRFDVPSSIEELDWTLFFGCSSLENIIVGSDNKIYSSMDGVLFNKDKTELLIYPAGKVNTDYSIPEGVLEVGRNAFWGCEKIMNITIPSSVWRLPGFDFYYKYQDDSAFVGSSSLKNIFVDSSNGYFSSEDGVLFNKNKTKLLYYPAGRMDTNYTIPAGITQIKWRAFKDCIGLENIIISNGVTSIGESAFEGCVRLEKITMPQSLTYIGENVFSYCNSLKEVKIDSDNKIYSSMDGVLFNKDKTELIYYPVSKINEDYTIPSSVKYIGDSSFEGCNNLKRVSIPSSVLRIGGAAFADCKGLRSVSISNEVDEIEEFAFAGCVNLTYINIPENIRVIDSSTFKDCSSLLSVNIPNAVTGIYSNAFSGCLALTNITIPTSLTFIDTEVFAGCANLSSVKILSENVDFSYDVFLDCYNVTIAGKSGSSAEKYAMSQCIPFSSMP